VSVADSLFIGVSSSFSCLSEADHIPAPALLVSKVPIAASRAAARSVDGLRKCQVSSASLQFGA
jgi:hypothetical protein